MHPEAARVAPPQLGQVRWRAVIASLTERTSAARPPDASTVLMRCCWSLESLSRPTLMSNSAYLPDGVQIKRSSTPAMLPL